MLALIVALFTATSYALVDGHSVTCHAPDNIGALRASYGSHFFWFRQDGASYVVRDEATLRSIHELFRRQRELGDEQARLGDKQAALGSEQSRLGSEQSELGTRVTYDRGAAARMRELGDQMRVLGNRMRVLGDQMRVLGDEMREEGRKIDRRLGAMMPELIRSGVAQEVER